MISIAIRHACHFALAASHAFRAGQTHHIFRFFISPKFSLLVLKRNLYPPGHLVSHDKAPPPCAMRHYVLAALVGVLTITLASGQATCNPKFWSPGHDFKNGQYSNVNASSPGDWCVCNSPRPAVLLTFLTEPYLPLLHCSAAPSVRPTLTRRSVSASSGPLTARGRAGSSPTTKVTARDPPISRAVPSTTCRCRRLRRRRRPQSRGPHPRRRRRRSGMESRSRSTF